MLISQLNAELQCDTCLMVVTDLAYLIAKRDDLRATCLAKLKTVYIMLWTYGSELVKCRCTLLFN